MNDSNNVNPGDRDLNEPISLEDDFNKPIPFDDSDTDVSHAPLNLGGNNTKAPTSVRPTQKKAEGKIVSSDRITGMKTFFTKLHAGSIDYLEQQINIWLRDNPGIIIKQTNTTTGMMVGKQTEPNIIVTIWY